MSSHTIHTTTYRLLKERLEATADYLAEGGHNLAPELAQQLARLAWGSVSLLEQHQVDDNGCCKVCHLGRRRWRRPRHRPARFCTVYRAFAFYINKPDEANEPSSHKDFVHDAGSARWSDTESDLERTMRLPRVGG